MSSSTSLKVLPIQIKKQRIQAKEQTDTLKIEYSRDKNITDFGKATLIDRYLLPGEKFQDMFMRVAKCYSDNDAHAQRIYDYISKMWFMPATPVLSNGGAKRGLPISCFLNTVQDSLTLAISQGSLRRGSAACYLDVHHPEIEEFLEIRKPSGDFNRKSLNLHHGINITDEFMECVKNDKEFSLRSPKTNETLRKINARELWQKILETRMQTGEPYLVFIDTVNKNMAKHQKNKGLKVTTSNLCSEIMLHTGVDHLGNERTAVCCLSSVNLEKWDEWSTDEMFIQDVMRFLDNVLEDFINNAPDSMKNAVYSAKRERSVGLGAMGFHSFLQKKGIPFESALAKSWNVKFFKHLKQEADKASVILAIEKGACPDADEEQVKARFSHKLAIAPTASISIICGGTSACIEPIPANIYTHKTLSGSFTVKKKFLEIYFYGVIFGGLFFLVSYNIFPVFKNSFSPLIGSSAAVYSILIFACTYMPETKVNLIFFDIKLKYLGLFYVLLSLIQIPFSNAGGNIAHLGGAFYGFYYAKNLNKSLNIPALEMLYKYFCHQMV